MHTIVNTNEARGPELLRLTAIVGPTGIFPVSRAGFYSYISRGMMPRPVKIGRVSLWRRSEIVAAIEALVS